MTQVALGRTTPELVLDDLGVVMRPTRFRSLIIMAALGVRWGWAKSAVEGQKRHERALGLPPRRISPAHRRRARLTDAWRTWVAPAVRAPRGRLG